MKILQLAPRLPFPLTDGGAIGIYNITKALAAAGHEVTLLTFPDKSREITEDALNEMGSFCDLRLVSRPLPSRLTTLVKTVFKGAYPIERRMMPEMYALIETALAEKSFDIVHVDHAHMGRYGLWIKQQFGLPVVLREHNFETLIYSRFAAVEKNPIKRFVARIHGKRLLKQEIQFISALDGVAAISPQDVSAMKHYVPAGNYRIIPAGVDSSYFSPSTSSQRGKILWVGGFDWDPNFDAAKFFLQDILPLILVRFPEAKLDMVGKASERISPYAKRFSANISIHGRVADIRDFLSDAAVLVVPLRIGGGMRLKLLEFFAAGKAVVSTTIGAEGNSCKTDEHLLIRDSAEDFANGVIQILQSPSLASRLGANARKLAVECYSWTAIAQQFEDLYRDVISN